MCLMRISSWLVAASLALCVLKVQAIAIETKVAKMKVVRTYLDFPEAIDPARIITMAELEISMALASTLITFNEDRQLISVLAKRWDIVSENQISFTLRDNLVWSDGTPITANDYKRSLERAKKFHGSDLKAFFDTVTSIVAKDTKTLVFTTTSEATRKALPIKITESMYALVATKSDGSIDFTKSSGPFMLEKKTAHELSLTANKRWFHYSSIMPERVEIRRPHKESDPFETFESDSWVNLIEGNSLMSTSAKEHLHTLGYKVWERTLDKVFSLFPSKRFIEMGGADWIKSVASKIDTQKLLEGSTGFQKADQFFPRGLDLWSPVAPKMAVSQPPAFNRPLKIILPDTFAGKTVAKYLGSALKELLEKSPEIQVLPVNDINGHLEAGDYDILATNFGVADPNFDGAMSFFIERNPPFIQSGPGKLDFASQVRDARGILDNKMRAAAMRKIIVSAQEAGLVLPLFHFATMAVAKPGVDISKLPHTDETIHFQKIRFE